MLLKHKVSHSIIRKKNIFKIVAIVTGLIIFFQIIPYENLLRNTKTTGGIYGNFSTINTTDGKNYFKRYPFLSKCNIEYKKKTKDGEPIQSELYDKRITRAVVFHFPIKDEKHYMKEFQWAYRSWIEMQKYEPTKWRTDLIVFLDNKEPDDKYKRFEYLNCTFKNTRTNEEDKPMCCLLPYTQIRYRNFTKVSKKFSTVEETYQYFFEKLDIFNANEVDFYPLYEKIQTIKHYGNIDSIAVTFDGYNYLKNKYNFLMRSDMDVFLTPLFAKWLPKACNEFSVGGGGYSTDFNVKRFIRIAQNLKMKHSGLRALGSTWYSTPNQIFVASYLTLVYMIYLSNEEFTSVESKGGIGTLNWPEWHYGVLSMYGADMALNHMHYFNETSVVKYPDLIDYGSGSDKDISKSVHIHVYHGENMFSKFMFYAGRYDNETIPENLTSTKNYCLYIALESKRLNASALSKLAQIESDKKN